MDAAAPPAAVGSAPPFRWLLLGAALVAAVVVGCAAAVSAELPFGEWDAMSYGTWARLIAEHWPHIRFAAAGPMDYHRPVFYFLEGTLWHVFGFHQALGRLLGLGFGILLALALAYAAARTAPRGYAAAAAGIAVALLFATAPFERYLVAGLSDVPVAAVLALTAALLWSRRLGSLRLPLVAASSCLALLTKPTALASLAGLAAAVLLGPRSDLRRRAPAAAAIAGGTALGLVYDAVQAHLSHVGLRTFLTTGSDGFYASLAAAKRTHELLDDSWLGADLRILVVFALAYALVRLVRPHRTAVAVAFVAAVVWSTLGPHLAAAGGGAVPGGGGTVQRLAVLAAAASLLFALAAPAGAIPARLDLARLLVWLAPPLVVWVLYSVYDVRLLSAAWPPLLLLVTRAFLPAVAGAAAVDAAAVAVPAAALLVVAAFGAVELNGFGNDGWHRFSTGFGDAAAMQSLALGGDFSAELAALAPQLPATKTVVTSDARLQFYYPQRVKLEGPQSCSQLAGAPATLVLLESDEDRAVYGERTLPGFWESCTHPRPTLVAERPGAFAVLTTGRPVAEPGGCGASAPAPGLAVEFGQFTTPAAADALVTHLKGLGFVQASVEQLGCSSYRVVETGVPSRAVGRSILVEARRAHLHVRLVGGS